MGCGISTYNLPSYMRGGRKSRQLGWQRDCDDDDQKIAIIDYHSTVGSVVDDLHDNDDPSHGRNINVSPPRAKNDLELDNRKETNDNTQSSNNNSAEISTRERHEDKEKEEEEESEQEFEREDNIDNLSWIGSPSFRDYCTNSHDSIDFDGKSDGENIENKAQGGLSHASPKPNEGSTESRRRGSRFRKVFPVGKSSAVKNILSVTTCYNPNHATSRVGHEK